jgi:diguanylate cyclase (GGDEF)-like protein
MLAPVTPVFASSVCPAPARPRRFAPLLALAVAALVVVAGMRMPLAGEFSPEQAARIAALSRQLAHAGTAAWQEADFLLGPVLGDRGRLGLAHLAGDAQWLLGNVGPGAAAPWAVMERSARRLGRTDAALDALREQIEMRLGGGDYASVEQLSLAMQELAVRGGRGLYQATAEGYLGVVARRRGQLDAARQHQENALALRRALEDEAGTAQALANLGTVYRDQGDFARALDLQLQALKLRQHLGGGERIDLSYRNIALLYREIEDAEQARANFVQALEAAQARHDPAALATVLGSFASFSNDTGEPNAALRMARQAQAIDESLGNRPYVGLESIEVGRALLTLGQTEEAGTALHEALKIGRELRHSEITGSALLYLGQLALRENRLALARAPLDEALHLLDDAKLKPQLAEALAVRQQLAEREDQAAAALELSKRHAALREELLGTKASRQLATLRARYERAEADQRIQLLNLDSEVQSLRLRQETVLRNVGFVAVVLLALLALVLARRYRLTRRLNQALSQKNAEISAHEAALEAINAKLSAHAGELYQAAITDPLTGAYNRGHLLRQLDERLRRCNAERRALAILLIDFDHFKQINDQHGHLFGDRVLANGVQVMRQWLEPLNLLGRYGGEEFIVILENQDLEHAAALGERLRERVAQALAEAIGASQPLTVSIGVASNEQTLELEALLNAADLALYRAKAEGRNRVVRFAA